MINLEVLALRASIHSLQLGAIPQGIAKQCAKGSSFRDRQIFDRYILM
jgi:hypothetical protein